MKNFKIRIAILVLGIAFFSSFTEKKISITGHVTGPYLQEIKNTLLLPAEPQPKIVKLIRQDNKVIAVGNDNLFYFSENKWVQKPVPGKWQSAALDTNGKLWLGTSGVIFNADDNIRIKFPQTSEKDTIHCIFRENEKTLLAGTDSGLWIWNGDWSLLKETEGIKVRQITQGKNDEIWLATSGGIFVRRNGKWINLNEYVMAPGLGLDYVSITNGSSPGDIIFGSAFAVGQISDEGNHWLLSGEDGLPYGPVTTISYSENEIWMGTPNGVIRKNEKWHYYNGKRWLPDNCVNDILRIDQNTVWIATPGGISEIKSVEMTLEQKAGRFETRLNQRHIHHGFVSDCSFASAGDTTSFICSTNDNDGLWSSIYLAAESFRYAVTGARDAYENAVRTFNAMERLETINPIPGFVARSYVTIDESTGDGGEWHVSADGKWKWKGDTSSDEIVGHMFAYPIFYELAAKGEDKERAKDLVNRLMSHIVDNNFHLIDLDGKPTRWGVWSPDSLNNVTDWWYEKGINSLQILSFLESAYFVTGDEKFDKAYHNLIENYGYAENMVQQKMYDPYEINHSDDELAFLPYYCLLRYARDPELKKTYMKSMQRSWNVEQNDRNPLWNIIASAALNTECDLDVAIEELKEYPVDIIKWDIENRHRWDLRKNPVNDRFLKEQATRVIPVDERGITKWNSNPYIFNYGGGGLSEDDGAAWLLPYWMGRYHKLIVEK